MLPPQNLAIEAVNAAVREAISTEPDVVAGYLFGSQVQGTAGPLSDVDVALLVNERSRAQATCGRVMDRLARQLRTSGIDVVSLEDAPMPLRYRVVRDGVLLVCRDAARVERFVVDTILHYLDFKPLRDRAFAHMRHAILESR